MLHYHIAPKVTELGKQDDIIANAYLTSAASALAQGLSSTTAIQRSEQIVAINNQLKSGEYSDEGRARALE
jgi:hypothetical protein